MNILLLVQFICTRCTGSYQALHKTVLHLCIRLFMCDINEQLTRCFCQFILLLFILFCIPA